MTLEMDIVDVYKRQPLSGEERDSIEIQDRISPSRRAVKC